MAAPAPTARESPAGIALHDGFPTKITLKGDPNIDLWERAVTLPSYDGGDPINTTSMFNVQYRTQRPPQLVTVGQIAFTALFDPGVYTQILARINQNDEITVEVYDGTTFAAWAWLRRFEPQEMTEGAEPLANVVIEVSNWDVANNTEAGPAISSVAGT